MLKAETWIENLELTPHPEGGYFKEVYRSEEAIQSGLPDRYNGKRSLSTSIYYLLLTGEFSSFHRLKSDEIWHFYYGSPLDIHIIKPDGFYKIVRLGQDICNGEKLQHTVERGIWFAATPVETNSYSLTGATVAPGFDFDDFELAKREELIKLFPEHEKIITKLTFD